MLAPPSFFWFVPDLPAVRREKEKKCSHWLDWTVWSREEQRGFFILLFFFLLQNCRRFRFSFSSPFLQPTFHISPTPTETMSLSTRLVITSNRVLRSPAAPAAPGTVVVDKTSGKIVEVLDTLKTRQDFAEDVVSAEDFIQAGDNVVMPGVVDAHVSDPPDTLLRLKRK